MRPPLSVTWVEALDRYTDWLTSAQRSKGTIALKRYHLERLATTSAIIEPFMATLDDLTLWLASFAWARETRRSYRTSLRSFYAWCHVTGRMSEDPAALLPPIKVPRGRPRPAPEDVVRDVISKAGARERLMARFAANGGLRRAEIACVHTDDLEVQNDGFVLRVRGKGDRVRLVPILDDFAREIERRPRGYLFPGKIDGHLSPRRVGELLSELMPSKWTAHTLRHRFASKSYEAQRDILAVQELLGHASVVTTQIYTAVPSGALRAAVESAA